VAPREIAESYGLSVQLVELPGDLNAVAGYIDLGDQVISVNAADPYNRKTFTIAHELGHYLLHRELFKQHPERYQVLLRRPIAVETDPLEKEANVFAAELLVPMAFLKLYGKYATPDELADLFAVSREVIGYRLKFANLAAVA
jgi:Zn-dependent peptidase ImmA (M78 family)